MNRGKFKTLTLVSVVASVLLMSGCGSSGGSTADTTPPEFTSSATIDVNENMQLNYTVVATDAGGSVSYSKDGGANEADFTINATTGVLTFDAPEVAADMDYKVNIKATDPSDNNTTQAITVTVKNVIVADETAPEFTSLAELNVTENMQLVHTVVATDAGGSVSYSEDNGTLHKDLFSIDATTGVLTFDAPAVSEDTDYVITVKATDLSENSQTQDITIVVKEAGSITNRAIMPIDTTGLFTRDATNNTVLNTKTGFVWEDTDTTDDNSTFAEAAAHCAQLKSSKFAGIDDWRLPSRADLFKLVDYLSSDSSFIDATFANRVAGVYWTSEEEGSVAWGVSYTGGTGDFRVDKTLQGAISTVFARCVSGDYQPPRFTGTHESQTRVDLDTGLEWQTHSYNGEYYNDVNWSTVQTRCESDGFRLPTINELRSIVEYDTGTVFGDLTIDVEIEGVGTVQESARSAENGLNGSVWTSTETSDGKIKALYIVKTGDTPITIKDEIYDTILEKNATAFDVKGVCVK